MTGGREGRVKRALNETEEDREIKKQMNRILN